MTNYLCKHDLRDSTTKGHPINDPAYEPISIRKTLVRKGQETACQKVLAGSD